MKIKRKRGFFQVSRDNPISWPRKKKSGWGWILGIIILLVALVWTSFNYGSSFLVDLTNFLARTNNKDVAENLTRDNIPPSPPQIDPLPEATNSASLTITGNAESETEVHLFLNGQEIKRIIVDKDGQFNAGQVELTKGENNFFAKAFNSLGGESQESVRQVIVLDQEPPSLEIDSPQNNDSLFGDKKEITIAGKTEKDALVSVNDRKVVVNLEGKFSAAYSLSEGSNKILIVASDKAGNKTEKTIKVSYRP